ncbi:MAG TPA: hypothetical protein VGH38_29120 [Bryobacteraceae bacterium]
METDLTSTPTPQLSTRRAAALLFTCTYLLHALMPISLQGDSRWTVPEALSLIHGRGPEMRVYAPAMAASGFYETECVGTDHVRRYPIHSLDECVGGHLYAFAPVAVPVLAAPFVAALEGSLRLAAPLLMPLAKRLQRPWLTAFLSGDLAGCTTIVENLVSSIFTAGAVTALYLAALELLPGPSALALALIFAFGTLMWSSVSRALGQHSPSIFFNAVLLLLLVRGNFGRMASAAAGFILAFAFFVRATNAVPILVFGVYLLLELRGRVVWVIAGGLLPTIGFGWLSLHMYGSPIAPVFLPVRAGSTSLALHSEIPRALVANLVSPGRGLFVFMPFFLFLLNPQVWRWKMPPRFLHLRPWICTLVVLHMLLVSTHADWWGGFSYGPRYLTDILPWLMVLWSPVLLWMAGNRLRLVAVGAAVAVSVAIQFRGATSIQVHRWNEVPVSVNERTDRIWDWTDPPFLR